MKFSVIVGAYNTHELTVAHVSSIMRDSTLIPDEIIVTNDGGDPSLREMLIPIQKKCPIIYTRIQQDIPWNYTGARNLGAVLSRGQYLIIEDTDHIPDSVFYEKAIQTMDAHPEYIKMQVRTRLKVSKADVLSGKPSSEWKSFGGRGTHHDSGVYRRIPYFQCKGFNEAFAGLYGWAQNDLNDKLKSMGKYIGQGTYYVVFDGIAEGDEDPRKPRSDNHSLLRKTRQRVQNTGLLTYGEGMLKFDYTVEVLEKNA